MRRRIYVDTSVIGGCFDEEFSFWSRKFFREVKKGLKIAVISDLTQTVRDSYPTGGYLMKKKFDAVAFQRRRRRALTKEYMKNPKAFYKSLQEQYGQLESNKKTKD